MTFLFGRVLLHPGGNDQTRPCGPVLVLPVVHIKMGLALGCTGLALGCTGLHWAPWGVHWACTGDVWGVTKCSFCGVTNHTPPQAHPNTKGGSYLWLPVVTCDCQWDVPAISLGQEKPPNSTEVEWRCILVGKFSRSKQAANLQLHRTQKWAYLENRSEFGDLKHTIEAAVRPAFECSA